jgi:hypothetical protein
MDSFSAACTGAWIHGEIGRTFGPGLIAEDLPEGAPKVLRALYLQRQGALNDGRARRAGYADVDLSIAPAEAVRAERDRL